MFYRKQLLGGAEKFGPLIVLIVVIPREYKSKIENARYARYRRVQ